MIDDWLFIILPLKAFFIILFVWLLIKWKKHNTSIAPIIVYWVFGLFFVFSLTHTFLISLFKIFFVDESNMLLEFDSLNSLSSLIGLVFYIFVGVKYFVKRTLKTGN